MALSLKNPETVRLARELARLRGQGVTEALTEALRRELERDKREARLQGREDGSKNQPTSGTGRSQS